MTSTGDSHTPVEEGGMTRVENLINLYKKTGMGRASGNAFPIFFSLVVSFITVIVTSIIHFDGSKKSDDTELFQKILIVGSGMAFVILLGMYFMTDGFVLAHESKMKSLIFAVFFSGSLLINIVFYSLKQIAERTHKYNYNQLKNSAANGDDYPEFDELSAKDNFFYGTHWEFYTNACVAVVSFILLGVNISEEAALAKDFSAQEKKWESRINQSLKSNEIQQQNIEKSERDIIVAQQSLDNKKRKLEEISAAIGSKKAELNSANTQLQLTALNDSAGIAQNIQDLYKNNIIYVTNRMAQLQSNQNMYTKSKEYVTGLIDNYSSKDTKEIGELVNSIRIERIDLNDDYDEQWKIFENLSESGVVFNPTMTSDLVMTQLLRFLEKNIIEIVSLYNVKDMLQTEDSLSANIQMIDRLKEAYPNMNLDDPRSTLVEKMEENRSSQFLGGPESRQSRFDETVLETKRGDIQKAYELWSYYSTRYQVRIDELTAINRVLSELASSNFLDTNFSSVFDETKFGALRFFMREDMDRESLFILNREADFPLEPEDLTELLLDGGIDSGGISAIEGIFNVPLVFIVRNEAKLGFFYKEENKKVVIKSLPSKKANDAQTVIDFGNMEQLDGLPLLDNYEDTVELKVANEYYENVIFNIDNSNTVLREEYSKFFEKAFEEKGQYTKHANEFNTPGMSDQIKNRLNSLDPSLPEGTFSLVPDVPRHELATPGLINEIVLLVDVFKGKFYSDPVDESKKLLFGVVEGEQSNSEGLKIFIRKQISNSSTRLLPSLGFGSSQNIWAGSISPHEIVQENITRAIQLVEALQARRDSEVITQETDSTVQSRIDSPDATVLDLSLAIETADASIESTQQEIGVIENKLSARTPRDELKITSLKIKKVETEKQKVKLQAKIDKLSEKNLETQRLGEADTEAATQVQNVENPDERARLTNAVARAQSDLDTKKEATRAMGTTIEVLNRRVQNATVEHQSAEAALAQNATDDTQREKNRTLAELTDARSDLARLENLMNEEREALRNKENMEGNLQNFETLLLRSERDIETTLARKKDEIRENTQRAEAGIDVNLRASLVPLEEQRSVLQTTLERDQNNLNRWQEERAARKTARTARRDGISPDDVRLNEMGKKNTRRKRPRASIKKT